jgi:uncharacterized protein YicC (UPF0701 family)
MPTITATNSATPSAGVATVRAKLEQARREADQAEINARNLRAQADDAERQAQSSQENVRKITSSVQRLESTYSRPGENKSAEVPAKVQKLIEQLYSATSEKRTKEGNPLKVDSNASPVVNSQGQKTGRIVNISA